MSGWWAERFASFALEVAPTITAAAAPRVQAVVNVPVSPAFSMQGAGTSTAAMDLVATPDVSFVGVNLLGTVSLNLVSALDMAATGQSTGAFTLALTPTVGMTGAEKYTATFVLTVSPSFAATAYVKQLPHPIPWTL